MPEPSHTLHLLTSPQQRLHHLLVSSLGGQGQRGQAVVAAGVRLRSGLQQQAHRSGSAQPRGLVQGPPAVAALLVHLGPPVEQQLQQVAAVRADG